jgi:hypothetical protein
LVTILMKTEENDLVLYQRNNIKITNMTHRTTGLECRVTDYIEQTYKAKFLGEVHVDISPNGVYTL